MRQILRILLSLLLLLHCRTLYAQKQGQALVDSLEMQLGNKQLSDTSKVNIMTTLCFEYREIVPNKGIEYGEKAVMLANKIKYGQKLGEIYFSLASCYQFYNDIVKSYEYSLLSVKYCREYKNNDIILMAEIYSTYFNPNHDDQQCKDILDSVLHNLAICKDPEWYVKTIGFLGSYYGYQFHEFKLSDSLNNIAIAEAEKHNYGFLTYHNIARKGINYIVKKEYDSAIVYLLSSLNYFDSIKDNRMRVEVEYRLAECYLYLYHGKQQLPGLQTGKKYALGSLEIARKMGYFIFEKNNFSLLSNIYNIERIQDSEIFYLRQSIAINESVFGSNARNRMEKVVVNAHDQIAKQQVKIKDVELQKQKVVTYSAISLVLLFSVSSVMIFRNYKKQKKYNDLLSIEKQKSENLLLNILPVEVAYELKEKGVADAKHFDNVTVLFTDFVNFTLAGEHMSPQGLVDELHTCFKAFDEITGRYNIEKIKTVGDAYLAVAGLPTADAKHAENTVRAAIEISAFMQDRIAKQGLKTFQVRIGIHSGSVVAGIVGVKKFAYDIWGDTVNTAARMEQNSEAGKINLSETTYELVRDKISCTYRGEIDAKGKGMLKMYYVG